MTRFHHTCVGVFVLAAIAASGNAARAQGTAAPYGTSNPSGLQAGGLAPPGSGSQTAPVSSYDPGSASMDQSFQKAEEKDSGRGLEFVWLNGEVGYEVLGLQTFKANNLVDAGLVKSTQQGLVFGGGLGVRLIFLTLGGRFRLGNFDNLQMWTADLEAGIHMPIGRVEPYFTAGFGYASMGAFNPSSNLMDLKGAGVDIHGWNARGGVGLDVYLTNVVTVGANLTGDVLFLKRPGVSQSDLQNATTGSATTTDEAVAKAQSVYAMDGSSIGAGMTATAVVGLHF